jgi:multisubunit Na+/H+ antiporter MnhB subunit
METTGTAMIDLLLGFLAVLLAGAGLLITQLFRAVLAFIGFGLVIAVVWVRLDAVDIALAEAMIGSGITGALFLAALGRMARAEEKADNGPAQRAPGAVSVRIDRVWSAARNLIRWASLSAAALILIATVLVLSAVFPLPAPQGGIRELAIRNLPDSGVSNPVTAVLLNFRAYDTLLEIGVVLLALLGLRAVGGRRQFDPRSDSVSVLSGFYRLILPLLILFSGYMVWVGKYEPGGAFQAAALLAAGGIIGLMSGADPLPRGLRTMGLRIIVSAGFAVFLSLGVLLWVQSGFFLGFAPPSAGWFILVIEVVATVSIAFSLIVLFLGSSGYPMSSGKTSRLPPMAGKTE